MDFQTYINQETPKKQPMFSVDLTFNDCLVWKVYDGWNVEIEIDKKKHTYLRLKKEPQNQYTGLYTMDEDGNKKSASVFNLKEI